MYRPATATMSTCSGRSPDSSSTALTAAHGKWREWRARDPLTHCDEPWLAAARAEIAREIDDAVAFADSGAFPGTEEVLSDVERRFA